VRGFRCNTVRGAGIRYSIVDGDSKASNALAHSPRFLRAACGIDVSACAGTSRTNPSAAECGSSETSNEFAGKSGAAAGKAAAEANTSPRHRNNSARDGSR
jgi:hypothetical protein